MGAGVMSPILKIRQSQAMGSIRSSIIVGGRNIAADKFVRAVNMSAHNDEAWVDLNHVDSPMGNTSEVQEGNGKLIHGGHEFYTVDNGKLKWDIVYPDAGSVPLIERFRVRHSSNLTFYKQTRAEIEAQGGEFLTPETEDSYAVYMDDKRDNQYQTGKVMHIYSPYYVDEVGAKSPLLTMTLSPDIDNAKMLVLSHTPEVTAWLNNAVGKITLDPVLGYDTVGGSAFGASKTTVGYRGGWQSSVAGEVVSFHIAIVSLAGAITLKVGLINTDQSSPYNVDGKTVVAYAEDSTSSASDDFNVGNLVINESVLANTWYRIAHIGDPAAAGFSIKGDIGASRTLNYRTGTTYANEFTDPTPATIKAGQTIFVSHWAVYTAAGGAAFNRSRIVNMGASGPQNRSTIANA